MWINDHLAHNMHRNLLDIQPLYSVTVVRNIFVMHFRLIVWSSACMCMHYVSKAFVASLRSCVKKTKKDKKHFSVFLRKWTIMSKVSHKYINSLWRNTSYNSDNTQVWIHCPSSQSCGVLSLTVTQPDIYFSGFPCSACLTQTSIYISADITRAYHLNGWQLHYSLPRLIWKQCYE